MKSITQLFLSFLNCKNIGDGRGNVFFNRYTVMKSPILSIYIHQFMRGDSDRCLHDHPWPFISIILRGGYWEEMRIDQEHMIEIGSENERWQLGRTVYHWRRPGSILWRLAKTAHRIDIKPGTHPWSLVIVGRKSRDWGFWTSGGWRKWIPGANPICEDKS